MSDENEEIIEEEFDIKKVKSALVEPEEEDLLVDPLLIEDIDPEELEDDSFSLYEVDDEGESAEFSY